jgi:hypothetical protein
VEQRSTPVSTARTIDPFTGEELGAERQWVIVRDGTGSAIQICTNWGTYELFEDSGNRAWVANNLRRALGSHTDHVLFEDRFSRNSGQGSDFSDYLLLYGQDIDGVLDQLFVRPGMFAPEPNIYRSIGGRSSTLADLADISPEELGQEVDRAFEAAIAVTDDLSDTTPSPDEVAPSVVDGEEVRVEVAPRAMQDTGTVILFAFPTSAPSVTADYDEESVSVDDNASFGDEQENVGVSGEAPLEPIAPSVPEDIDSSVEQLLAAVSRDGLAELTEQVIARAREEALRIGGLKPQIREEASPVQSSETSAVADGPPELPPGFDPNDL